MPLSNRTRQALLNSFLGKTSNFGALATVPTLYIGLSTTTPATDGTGVTEPSGSAYARVATTAATWNSASAASPSVADNSAAITFPTATGSWGTVTNVVIYDASTTGNLLAHGALTTSKTISNGDTAQFAANDLSFSAT